MLHPFTPRAKIARGYTMPPCGLKPVNSSPRQHGHTTHHKGLDNLSLPFGKSSCQNQTRHVFFCQNGMENPCLKYITPYKTRSCIFFWILAQALQFFKALACLRTVRLH
jgi:hypothetical protein